jgi:hypothetical protein
VQLAALPLPAHAAVPAGPRQSGVRANSAVAIAPQKLSEGEKGILGPQAGGLLISEFRLRGLNGAQDEFIELYNDSTSPLTVNTSDGSAGYSVATSDGVVRFIIPNGTVIPPRARYLGVNSNGYSLSNYPANGTTATGDATYTTDIPDNVGIALFNTATPANFTLANRLDAVGSTSEANSLYKEGTGYPPLNTFSVNYSLYRAFDLTTRLPLDTNNNETDFRLVDTEGTPLCTSTANFQCQRLGAPGPENLSGPTLTANSIAASLIDTGVAQNAAPNEERDNTTDPPNNAVFGTITYRRKITNTTGTPITRLRFRVINITTFPAPSGTGDLRPRTSSNTFVNTSSSGTVFVEGTTLETPPAQPNGGGFNSTLSVGSISGANPLPPGASINVQFVLGVQQTGTFIFETDLFSPAPPPPPTTFTVTNTNDSGAGSLRQAITDSNSTAGTQTIQFNIPGGGVQTIRPGSPLPQISDPIIIDGTTQPGFAGTPIIEVDGTNAGTPGIICFIVNAGNSLIKGLVINRFSAAAIRLDTGGGNTVVGNFLGTDPTGTASLANGGGVSIINSPNNLVGGTTAAARNLLSGNTNNGVFISSSGSVNNQVLGNYIGTNINGTSALGNNGGGVNIVGGSNNLIGGTAAGARNVISGNNSAGIFLSNSSTNTNQVQGNYIGTNAAGTAALANSGDGIFILGGSHDNVIGGPTSAARNIISGNNGNGLSFRDTGTSNNTVAGNYIGTDVNGTTAVANHQSGVIFGNNAVNNTVGGTAAGAGNVISGNQGDGANTGLYGSGPGGSITIQGNLIGVNANGTAALGNGGFGIQVNSTPNNVIGGTAAGARNVISGNNFGGVIVGGSAASGNVIQGNYIGTNPSGTTALANNVFGVHISDAPNNLIGGTTASARNIISGNTGIAANGTGHGIQIDGSNATGNLVQGNYIGIDASGNVAVPNVRSGIFIFSGATSNTVGGAAAGARNVISGNSVRALNGNLDLAGIDIQASGNTVSGNYIGTNATGAPVLPNGSGVSFSGANNTATNNLISGNTQQGISVSNGSGNAILSNAIFANGSIGIVLFNGGNGTQQAPVLTSAISDGSITTLQGTLSSAASTAYTVQFFANSACDPSGAGEGQVFIGSTPATTDAGGNATFSFQSSTPGGPVITATATSAANNTSQFSICRQVVAQGLTISGRATDTGNNGLGGVNVTLSGTLSQVVQTDAAGNYSFTVPAGGNYTVIATSPYYVFAQPRADFTNLTSNQTVNFVALAQATPTPTPPLTDDFNGNQRDPNKWNLGTVSQPAAAVDPQVSVVQQSGQLTITPLANAQGAHYNGYVSVQAFNFTGAQTSVEVPQVATGGAETDFGIGSDNQNNYRFSVMTLGQAASAGFVSMERFRAQWGPLDAVLLVLVFQVRIAGVVTQEVIPYDPTAHRFWRFRHDAPVNALLFETSPDNSAFTERYRKVLDKSVSALAVELSAGTATPTAGGNPAIFDNLSLVASSVQFSLTNLTVSEAAVRATITVSRSGNVAGSPATLTYATVDNPAAVRCDDTTTLPGVAFARCDYATTVDTLSFAAGETTKTFSVPIIDDSFVEGNETFTLVLRNATGASLGAPGLISVTITDNDQPGQPNPVFASPFFIRQHYLDFLAREPDAGGFNAYLNLLTNCQDVNNVDPNAPAAACDRITVSGAFFGSPEFKDKGVYTIVFYRAALNRLPKYAEFAQDLRAVTGRTGTEAAAKRAAFAVDFAQRTEFTALYPATMTHAAFVDALLGRYSLTQITAPDPQNPEGGVKVTLTKADLVSGLTANTLARAQVLRAVVQSEQVGGSAEALNAFVAAQYYGYLRRTPDTPGFNAWVNYLTAHQGDFRTMVNGFMNSQEYRLRFGALNQ